MCPHKPCMWARHACVRLAWGLSQIRALCGTFRVGNGAKLTRFGVVGVGPVVHPLICAPLWFAACRRRTATVQRSLVQLAVGQHGVEEDSRTLLGFHSKPAIAVLVIKVPRIVLNTALVECAGEIPTSIIRGWSCVSNAKCAHMSSAVAVSTDRFLSKTKTSS